jgi:dipeptidyl-peptidase-3
LKDHIYALEPEPSLSIGKRELGHVNNYYLGDPITDDEVAAVQSAAEKTKIDILNTRYATATVSEPCDLVYVAYSMQCPEE